MLSIFSYVSGPSVCLPWRSVCSSPLPIFFFNFFYCYAITVVCLFSPSLYPTPGEPTSLPPLHPPPWFCPCVLYSSSCNPLFPLSLPHSPLAIVRLFLTTMSLVILCLLLFFFLLIMFQLRVRSYGICPSPPGLFHLA